MFSINKSDIEERKLQYNRKPFNISALIPDNDTRLLADEYRFYVLSLNEYLTTRKIHITQIEIFHKIEDWIYNNTKGKLKDKPRSILVINSARELIFICGFWASQSILSPIQKQALIDVINKEKDLAEKRLNKISDAVKNTAGIKVDEEYTENLTAWNNYLVLITEYLKYLHTNKGFPAIVYFVIEVKSKEILELTGIPKKEITLFLTELFVDFRFINKKEKVKYSYNLYRNLNRISKIERIKEFSNLIKRITSL
jgi:hypothetical protein